MRVKKILEIPQDHPVLETFPLDEFIQKLSQTADLQTVEAQIAKYNEDYPKQSDIYLHDYSDDFFQQLDDICGAKYFRTLSLVKALTLALAFQYRRVYVQTLGDAFVDSYMEEQFHFPTRYNDPVLDAPVDAYRFTTEDREFVLSSKAHLMFNPVSNKYSLQDLLTGQYVSFTLGYFSEVTPKWFELNSDKKY